MKVDITFDKVLKLIILPVGVAIIGFMWHVHARLSVLESQQSLSQRVKNLEDVILPILVEFNLQKRVEEELEKIEKDNKPTKSLPPDVYKNPDRPKNRRILKDSFRDEATKWANNQIEQCEPNE